MRYFHLAIASALLFFPIHTFASIIDIPGQALQGSTVEIELPADDISDVTGTFQGQNILFYKTEHLPKADEVISRAEFLEMMFNSYDFSEVDTNKTKDFSDVDSTSPYYECVNKAAALNIVNGYLDGKFHPYDPVTRGQIAKILVNAFKPQTTDLKEINFSDVPENHVFYNYIQKAINAGYFKGYPDGLMRPDRSINFSEAQIVNQRAAKSGTLPIIKEKKYYHAYMGVNRLLQPGTKTINLTVRTPNYDPEAKTIPIEVIKRDVPVIRFSLPKSKTDLFGDDAQDKTWTAIDGAKINTSTEKLWNDKFILPTKGEITLGFGDKLYINGVYSGSHFGIDYANNEGTEVHAANNGIVTLAEFTPAYGNTVVIDHGQNIFTMYLHMSELKTAKGATVEQGDLIGLMGSTGISSGSHLHYTLFIGGVIVDSDEWLSL